MKILFVTRHEIAHALISRPNDEIPRDVTSCNLVEKQQRFGRICSFRPETGRSKLLRNVSFHLPKYTTRHFVIRYYLKRQESIPIYFIVTGKLRDSPYWENQLYNTILFKVVVHQMSCYAYLHTSNSFTKSLLQIVT